jgi:orotidine-5'-phosphate decarboxylase
MSESQFQTHIRQSVEQHHSRIVLALDLVEADLDILFQNSLHAIQSLAPYLCAVKLNRHLILPLGLTPKISQLIQAAHQVGLPVIMDCKVNDIGNTNRVITQHYMQAGFDALTANPFVGWTDGLEPVFSVMKGKGRGVILLVYMSHKGTTEGYGQQVLDESTNNTRFQYEIFAEKARDWKADGVVVGATYPEKIAEVHRILGDDIPIFTPGIGTQGGRIAAAAHAGAQYFIIGRSILYSQDPIHQVQEFQQTINKYMG